MSTEAIKAFESLVPYLRGMRDAASLNRNVRTSTVNISVVGAKLAYRFGDNKGYVDETIEQLCEVLPIGYDTVSRALQCLNSLDIWITEDRGSKRYGTRRVPGPELCAAAHRIGIQLHALSRGVQLDLGVTARDIACSSEPTPRDSAVNSTRQRVPTPRASALLLKRPIEPKDDDRPRGSSDTSSSSWYDLSKLAIQRLADDARSAGKITSNIERYKRATAENWRTERDEQGNTRAEKIKYWHRAGLDDERVITLAIADAPINASSNSPATASAAAVVIEHPPDCQCGGGDGWTTILEADGRGGKREVTVRCLAVSA